MRIEIKLLRAWQRIAGEIVAGGGMATKSLVGERLMEKYGLDRAQAHDVCNSAQSYNLKPYRRDKENEGGIWAARLIRLETLNWPLR